MHKMDDVLKNPLSIANRDSIWATSWTMYTERPLRGVGLGQYKWHYLDAQREMLKRWPGMRWQYTHWAHNEFLQWFAETGTAGGLLMVFLWGWWAVSAFSAFLRKRSHSPEAYWGAPWSPFFSSTPCGHGPSTA
jgi:O-antigen ligase